MTGGTGSAFDSIESAYDFVSLLAETVVESRRELQADVRRESRSISSRRLDALRVALYNLEKLELHMKSSKRILNDLRTLRRLLFEERSRNALKKQPAAVVKAVAPSSPSSSEENHSRAKSQKAAGRD
jgi:hypothetical protein